MYVAVKGGAAAIDAAHRLLASDRRGDPSVPELTIEQIDRQLGLAVDRVMAEGGVHDRRLAAIALKQASGDAVEAIFLVRAYRATLPRLASTEPIDTARMSLDRRISATYKDLPGGQVLGPTYDYTHRLIDFALETPSGEPGAPLTATPSDEPVPRVNDLLDGEGLIEESRFDPDHPIADITREPPEFPMDRDARLQTLARGDEGFLLALGYSAQRGYGSIHPFAGEIRQGRVVIEIIPPELGFAIEIGEIEITECQMIGQFKGSATEPARFTRGYGLVFGRAERKAMAMALVDRALRAEELGEAADAPAQDQEFVLSHADNVEASGFVQHLKLPHYVDFQSELELVRRLRAASSAKAAE